MKQNHEFKVRMAIRATTAITIAALVAPLAAHAADAGGTPAQAAPAARKGAADKQPVAAAPSLPRLSAEQIVEKSIAAQGGAGAWRAISSMAYSGKLDAGKVRPDNGMNPASKERPLDKPGPQTKPGQKTEPNATQVDNGAPVSLPYTLYVQRPKMQRMEIVFKDETLVQVYDGKNGWKQQPYLKRGVLPFTDEEKKKAEEFPDIDGPLVDYAAKGTKVALDGTDLVDGKAAYRLKLSYRNGDTRHLWIDGQNFLQVQIDGTRRLNGHPATIYTAMRDYRAVQGVKVPFLMETRTDGMDDREKIVVEKVSVNQKLDAALFAKPR